MVLDVLFRVGSEANSLGMSKGQACTALPYCLLSVTEVQFISI